MMAYGLLLLAYVVGATPSSLWMGRVVYGVDLRREGSGNLGATNTFRVLGWKAALPVFLADILKGYLPVALFPGIAGINGAGWALAFGAAAILGHVFSFWVGFRGGKGVATSTGVFLALAPLALLAVLVVWSALVATTRIVSLGSIAAAATLPVAILLVPNEGGASLVLFASGLALFVIWAHRENLARLARGEEARFGSRASQDSSPAGDKREAAHDG
jgi:acyl phosphate:glycerol-3-phosphate acyltransferase